jgi:tetratricopeptide (TPR) repeat protein
VMGAMEVEVGGADRERLVEVPTRDPVAYDAYLRGRAATNWNADVSPPALRRAIPHVEEAIRRDSAMVDAWGELARLRMLLYANGREQTPALAASARAAVERMMALDPDGVRGLLVRGSYRRLVAVDLAGARADLEAAVRRDPGDYRGRSNLAYLLAQDLGRPAEALPHLERATTLDPRAVGPWSMRAQALVTLGRFDEARIAADHALALAPTLARALDARVHVDLAAGDSAAARATLARVTRNLADGRTLLILSNTSGWLMDAPTAARALATGPEAFDGDRGSWATALAVTHHYRGDTARARAWADTAIRYLAKDASRPGAGVAVLADLALAEAIASRPTAAATAGRALAMLPPTANLTRRTIGLFNLASAAAIAGARDSSLAWLTELRSYPNHYTSAFLRLDPAFASLRGDPRFEALLARQLAPPR